MPFQYSTIIKKINEIPHEENRKTVYEFLSLAPIVKKILNIR